MATLDEASRVELWKAYQSDLSRAREAVSLTKADLRAAVNALDDFLDSNAAAINAAIPQPARSSLTVPQKARLLMFVIQKRFMKG